MKHIPVLFLLSILLFQCKKDKTEDPDPRIAKIVGKWRFDAREVEENGKKTWQLQSGVTSNYIIIRSDGVMLDADGLRLCCSPIAYNLNGAHFQIIPKTDVPYNPTCVSVDCVGCDTLQLDQIGNELVITSCLDERRTKYVRD